MFPKVENEQRSNATQLIKIVFENGNTFNIRAYPDGELQIDGGFRGSLIIRPVTSHEITITHE